MSIKKKLPILFTILVLLILIANNTHHYIRSKNNLVENYEREISLVSQQVSYQVENAKEGSHYVEDIIGRELRTASIAIRNSLPANHEDVTNEQLKELASELMLSHITLLAKTPNDIVGVKSSDAHEINMSTKDWTYWYDAFQQLFNEVPVQVEAGQSLPNYWSGPIEIASSNPEHTDKWGYYYDGTTNYIINPYFRDNQILDYEKRFGPTNVMEKVTEKFEGVLELSVFNPSNFGKEEEVVHLNGNSFVRISEQPIWYGTYKYQNIDVDSKYIQVAVHSGRIQSYSDTINGKNVKKTFVPIDVDTEEPYVIGLAYDNEMIQQELNEELLNYLYSSLAFMIIVLLFSFIFTNSITKPIALIVDHVNEIAKGNFEKRLKLDRNDELGHLASNVNSLSQDLKSYMDNLKDSQKVIKYQAYHDPLTSLPNRRYIQEKLKDMLHKASIDNSVVAVIFMDIDRFKNINDSMGHKMGDQLIKLISNRIQSCLVDHESVVARQGGDEFIILMKDLSEKKVEEITNEIVSQIKKPFDLSGREIFVGASCGISYYPNHSVDMESLIVNADMAMYAAKKQGGNKVVIYNPIDSEQTKDTLKVEEGLRKAIQNDLLDVYYQPKVDATTGKIVGAEALVRWNSKENGFVSPCIFIPIAENTGLIQPLFELVLYKSLTEMKKWNENLEEKIAVSVNVSPVQFLESKTLVESIKRTLRKTDFPPELLEIEITESALLNNMSETIEALNELHELGVAISVDDFGTGYSSLSYLKKLPINTLKIDQSFIKDIGENGSNTEITEAIINLARSLKLGIIAEGVEEEHQKQYLINNGCHFMQGYLFSRPLDVHSFGKLIEE